jgi:hypothetical protein
VGGAGQRRARVGEESSRRRPVARSEAGREDGVIERTLLLLSGSCSVWCLGSTPARIHTSWSHAQLAPATLFIFRNFLPRLFIYFIKSLFIKYK